VSHFGTRADRKRHESYAGRENVTFFRREARQMFGLTSAAVGAAESIQGVEEKAMNNQPYGVDGAPQDNGREAVSPGAALETVRAAVGSWEGVTTGEHRFGGSEFRHGRRELGHLHRTFADLPFPRRVRDELIATGRATSHHVLPDSGWVTAPMRTAAEVTNVIELFRQNYLRGSTVRR
jgi:hypothetical protein